MGDTIYPIDSVRPIRARDLIQRCWDEAALQALVGMTEGALAHVAGSGLWRYASGVWVKDIDADRYGATAQLLDVLGW